MAKSLPAYFFNPFFMIYYFIFENDFTSEGKRNYFYFIVNFILSIIIDIFAAIYNEFFILNCFGLQKDTHYGISERAIDNSLVELDDIERQNSIENDWISIYFWIKYIILNLKINSGRKNKIHLEINN